MTSPNNSLSHAYPQIIPIPAPWAEPLCIVCREKATHLVDLSTLSATIAPVPWEARCEKHLPRPADNEVYLPKE